MKAVIYSETGAPSVLRVVERKPAEPGPGEVRVRIVVSGVNPTDWKTRTGATAGQKLPFPDMVPNQDGSGVVDAVGEGVTRVAVGDRVWVSLAAHQLPAGGTAQEYSVLPAERVFPLPENQSFDVGASIGVPAVTAHRALTVAEDGPSRLAPGALEGTRVLVSGGAGAVGHAAIQLARWAGATVLATVSTAEKGRLATAAGAHHVFNYRQEGVAKAIRAVAPDGVDLIVEVSPAVNSALDVAVIRNRGCIAVYANNGGDQMLLDVRRHFALNVRYQFLLLYTVGDEELAAAGEDIAAALADDVLPVGEEVGLPLHRFDLEHTALAHAAVEAGATGKVLIDVADAGTFPAS